MRKNKYLTPRLTVLAGLLLSSSLAIAGTSDDFTEKVKPFPIQDAKKNCLSQDGVFLENNYVATCVTQDGTFGAHQDVLGMTFNPEGTGTITTPDFLQPGKAFEFFSVSLNGQNYANNNTGEQDIDTKVIPLERLSHAEQPGGAMAYSVVQGKDGALLELTQKYTVDPNAREIIVRVEMRNVGEKPIEKLHYARGIDPNQDAHTYNTHYTHNTRGGSFGGLAIDVENIVQATGKKTLLALGLYSVDKEAHNTCISAAWTIDAVAIYNRDYAVCTTKDSYFDATINLGFKLGSLNPRETKVFSFKYLFDVTKPTKPIDRAAFIIEVKTDNNGVSANNAFTIPTRGREYNYNYNVDCDSDGINEAVGIEGHYTCEYENPGTYTISIKDNTGEGTGFPAIHFEDTAYGAKDFLKLIKIKQWGGGEWLTMEGAFWNCRNMDSDATDIPDISSVTNMGWMFSHCSTYQGGTTPHWDVSNVKKMNSMFDGAHTFNKPIGHWNVSSVTNMAGMFCDARTFNKPISHWNVSSVTNMVAMFYGARSFSNHDLSSWDVTNIIGHDYFSFGWGTGNTEPNWL